ncbi:MAG: glycosyltransferase involved in cell wall biosynthesis [Ulvibacter sp.]
MKKIKVLHINKSDSGGGAEKLTLDFVKYAPVESYMLADESKSGLPNVDVLTKIRLQDYFTFFDKVLWKVGIRKFSFKKWIPKAKIKYGWQDMLNFTWYNLKRSSFFAQADVIHCHNLHGGYFDITALEKIAKKKPVIWSLHDMWAITGGEPYLFSEEYYNKSKRVPPFNNQRYPFKGVEKDRRDLYLKQRKNVFKRAQSQLYLVVASPWLKNKIDKAFVFDSAPKVRQIREGIDTSLYKNLELRNWNVPRILIVNTGNFYKGTEIFIDFFPELQGEYELWVIGKAFDLNLGSQNKVKQLEYVKEESELVVLLNQVDILIFPSVIDNSPLMVISAMACGVCVIGSRTGGIQFQLSEETGYLFETESRSDLKKQLTAALQNLEATRRKGQKARKRVEEMFNSEKMYQEYLELYKEALTNE